MQDFTQQASVPLTKAEEHAAFIRRTYGHLAGAVLAFIGLEAYMLHSPIAEMMLRFISHGQYSWLMVLGAFMICGWLARGLALRTDSQTIQYVGLTLYVIAEAVIFIPMLYVAMFYSSPEILPTAAVMTLMLFAGLTAVVFMSRKDFSFMRSILAMGGLIALGLIVCSVVFGFTLGLAFSAGMVVLASGAILYDTSNILHHYRTDQHVAAALSLFASVAMLFWYILRILNRR